MKRLLGLLTMIAFLLAIPVSHLVWGQEHVPPHKEQVCHKGTVLTVGAAAVEGHLDHGDCFIDKDTQIPALFTGDACVCDCDTA